MKSFCFNHNKRVIDGNIVNKKYKKFNKYSPIRVLGLEFINKNSVQNDALFFTNKLQRSGGKRIKMLKTVINDLIMCPDKLNSYFDGDEVNMSTSSDILKLERLDKILHLYEEVPNNNFVYKFVPNKNFYDEYNDGNYERGFQLFFASSSGFIKVYLIDLYHLGIPSKNNDLRSEYILRRDYAKCLSKCVFDCERDTYKV